MAFPETIKLEAKRRSNFSCCICKEPFVEVHHIIPQAENGPDTLENAATLCASCHDLFGANPEKRKQIREMRDFWWQVCENRNSSPDTVALNKKLDEIQTNIVSKQLAQTQALTELKNAFMAYHGGAQTHIALSGSISELSGVTGTVIPTPSLIELKEG